MKYIVALFILLFPTLALAQSTNSATVPVISDRNITPYDCSGTIVTGGTSQFLLPITGASPNKSPNVRGFMLMNVDTAAENLCISFNGIGSSVVTCNTPSYYGLAPASATASGGSYSSQLGFGPANNPVIVAATTGHRFVCTYW